ncbi:hypothetical protein ACFU5P_27815 [Streptomyces sp. NPDC057433]
MGRDLGLDGVVDHFALNSDEAGELRNKTGQRGWAPPFSSNS